MEDPALPVPVPAATKVPPLGPSGKVKVIVSEVPAARVPPVELKLTKLPGVVALTVFRGPVTLANMTFGSEKVNANWLTLKSGVTVYE